MAGSDPLAQSMVEILADTSQFEPSLLKNVEAASQTAADSASAIFTEGLDAGAETAAESFSTILGEGMTTAGSSAAALCGAAFDDAMGIQGTTIAGTFAEIGSESAAALADSFSTEAAAAMEAAGEVSVQAFGNILTPGLVGDAVDAVAAMAETLTEAARAAGVEAGTAMSEGVGESSSSVAELGSALGDKLATGAKLGGLAIAAGTAEITKFGLEGAANIQKADIAFQHMTGSAQAGVDTVNALETQAAKTPFQFQDLEPVAQRFLAIGSAAGITASNVTTYTGALEDATVYSGGTAESMSRVALALDEVSSKGKLTQASVTQLSRDMPGLNVQQILAAGSGMSLAQVQTAIHDGTLNASDGINDYITGLEKVPGVSGAAAAASQTLGGSFSTLKDNIRLALTQGFAPVIPQITQTLNAIIVPLSAGFQKLGPIIGQAITTFLPILTTAFNGIVPIMAAGVQAFASVAAPIGEIFKVLGPVIGQFITAVTPLASTIGILVEALARFLAYLQPLIPVIAQFVTQLVNPVLVDAIGNFLDALIPLANTLGQAFFQALTAILPILSPLVDGFTNLVTAFTPVFTQVVEGLATGFIKVFTALTPLVPLLANGLQKFFMAIAPVLPQLVPAFVNLAVAMVPLVGAIAQAATEFAPFVAQLVAAGVVNILVPAIDALAKGLEILTPILGPLVEIWTGLVVVVKAAELAMAAFDLVADANPIGLIIAAIALAVGAFYELYTHVAIVRDIVHDVWVVLQTVGGWIADVFVAQWDLAVAIFDTVVKAFENIPAAFDAGLKFIEGLFSAAWSAITKGADAVISWFEQLPGMILRELAALPMQLVDLFVGGLKLVLQGIGATIGLIIVAFIELGKGIIFLFTTFPEDLAHWFTEAGVEVLATVTKWALEVGLWATGLVNDIVTEVEALPGQLEDLFVTAGLDVMNTAISWGKSIVAFFTALPGQILDAIRDLGIQLDTFFLKLFDTVSKDVTNGIDTLVGWFKAIPGKLADLGVDLVKAGENLITSIFDGFAKAPSVGLNIAKSIVNGIVGGINWAIGQINSGLESIHIPGTDIHVPGIPLIPQWTATGGIFNSPTVIGVGEAGKEAVIPLTNPARAVQLAQQSGLTDLLNKAGATQKPTQIINMTVNTVAQDPQTVATQVVAQLARKAA